jgi:hypothetical protein
MHSMLRSARVARAMLSCALVLFAACGGGGDGSASPPTPTGPITPTTPAVPIAVVLGASTANLSVGSTLQFQATVSGSNNTAVTWSSSQPDVVSVSASGLLTALRTGLATITATSVADPSKSASAAVVVTAAVGTAITSGTPMSGLSGAEDSQKYYRVTVPVGTKTLEVTTTGGTGDLDLYLRPGVPPSSTGVTCASEGNDTVERCTITDPTPGDWYILILGFEAYGGVTMTVTATPGTANGGGSNGGGSTTGAIAVSASPTTVTAQRGTSVGVALTVSRTAPFTGAVTLSQEGLPANTSATFSPTSLASGVTASTLTISITSTAALGTYPVTVRAKGTGVTDATATFQLVITAPSTGGGGGTGSVSFASARLLVPPGFPTNGGIVDLVATNEGAYVEFMDAAEKSVVARFETGGTDSEWSTFKPENSLGGWAPVSLTQERGGAFSIYWTETTMACNWNDQSTAQSGMYNLNTGTPEFRWTNDLCVATFVASADEMESQHRTWALAANGAVYLEKAAKSGNKLSGSYEKVAQLPAYVSAAAAHPTSSSLYAASAGKLYEISLTGGIAKSWDLSGFGQSLIGVHKLRFVGSTLWIGYEGKILRLGTDGQVRQFAEGLPSSAFGTFCVQGGSVYVSDGNRYDIATGAKRTWIADRELSQLTSPTDLQKYMDIFGAVAGGMMDCSSSRSAIYVTGQKGLYEIVPK